MDDLHEKKILIVDDDAGIRTMIGVVLKKEQFSNIYSAENGREAVDVSREVKPDLIILDIMLPDFDGYEVCKKVREFSICPILFLSAKSDESDRIMSFYSGGDDYITKPFSPKELVAHIRAIFRRQGYYASEGSQESSNTNSNTFSFGDFTLDFGKRLLLRDGVPVALSPKEYLLLEFMVQNRNICLSRDTIVERVWESSFDGFDNTVNVHMHHLRNKIEADCANPVWLKTIVGRGYMFEFNEKRTN